MDELHQLFNDFVDVSDVHTHAEFMRRFIRIMQTLMSIITETLIDARDIHDRHELYGLVFSDIVNLRERLQQYAEILEFEE